MRVSPARPPGRRPGDPAEAVFQLLDNENPRLAAARADAIR
jgi:hypothetical protein